MLRDKLTAVTAAIIAFAPVVAATTATATPLREVAPTLIDAAPDQETFLEVLSPAPEADPEDRAKASAALSDKMTELRRTYDEAQGRSKLARPLYEWTVLQQEHAFDVRDQGIERYIEALDKWQIYETLVQPKLDKEPYRNELLKRLAALREVLGNFPNDMRRDELNWATASTLARVGNTQCETYFREATEHAKSPEWILKAKISRADYLVATEHADQAIPLYTDVRKTAVEPLKSYVTYRLGWIHLSRGWKATGSARDEAFTKAEAALKLVVIGLADYEDKSRFALRSEAGSDLAWLWALTGNEKEAVAFFQKHEMPDKLAPFREKLAREWLTQGKADKAVAFFNDLIVKNPKDPRVPDYHLVLAQTYIAASDPKGIQTELGALQRLSSDKDDPWFDKFEDDQKRVSRVKTIVKQLPLTIGFTLYKVAQSERDPKKKTRLLEGAVRELNSQLTSQPDKVAEIRATLIAALTSLDRLPEALDQIDAVIKAGVAPDRLAGLVTDRLNLIVKLDDAQTYPPLPAAGKIKTPLALPPLKKRFAIAVDDYLRVVPEAPMAPNLLYQVAQDLYAYGHYDEALARLESLILTHPKTDQARAAIEQTMSYRLKQENWDELSRLASTFLKNASLKATKDVRIYLRQHLDYANERRRTQNATAH